MFWNIPGTFQAKGFCLERPDVLFSGTWADHPVSSKWAANLRYLGLLHVLGHVMVEGCNGLAPALGVVEWWWALVFLDGCH